jgi:hypothetical protein
LSKGNENFKDIDENFDELNENEKEEEEEEKKENKDDIENEKKEIQNESKKPTHEIGKTVKVKLVIAEICKTNAQKNLRKMLSPIMTTFDTNQQFGMFHSALIVGPWYLEW